MSYQKSNGSPATGDFAVDTTFASSPIPARLAAARSEHADNMQRVFDDALAAVRLATPECNKSPNARLRYERNYQRMRDAARTVVLAGRSVQVPKYIPPVKTQETYQTLTAADFPESCGYQENKDKRNLPAAAPDFSRPESDETQAWLSSQGAAPITTHGMSPADADKAKRKRAGVPS